MASIVEINNAVRFSTSSEVRTEITACQNVIPAPAYASQKYHLKLSENFRRDLLFEISNQIRETRLSPRRAPRRSLLPLSPKRTQVRLKSLLYLVWLAPDSFRTHGRPPVQERRLGLKRPPSSSRKLARHLPFKSSTAARSCSYGLFPWAALLRFAFGQFHMSTRCSGILVLLRRCPRASFKELRQFLPKGKAEAVMAALSISNVADAEHALSAPLNNPEAIFRANLDMKGLHQEVVRVVLLDTQHRCITKVNISRGTANESLAAPREIFRPSIIHSAYAFVLVHNL